MSEELSELLPCPNPWCELGEPFVRRAAGGRGGDAYHVLCDRCGTAGPEHPTRPAAIAGWNTRKSLEPGEPGDAVWRDASQPAPEGQPVLGLYRAFNRPNGRVMTHVVWWWQGDWRIYPFTGNHGHVERWRPLAASG